MYVVDSNVFMQAANTYYAFDLVPAFWDWLETRIGTDIFTITAVKEEILAQNDQLANWFASVDDPKWVLPVDDEHTQLQMPKITQHCVDYGYKLPGITKFLSGADPWVIACARAKGWIVVTHEESNPDTKKRVKIPDVCNNLDVQHMMAFEMLRILGFTAKG